MFCNLRKAFLALLLAYYLLDWGSDNPIGLFWKPQKAMAASNISGP